MNSRVHPFISALQHVIDVFIRHPAVRYVSIITVGLLVPGFALGYRNVTVYLVFWILNTALFVTSSLLISRFAPGVTRTDSLIRICIVAFALAISTEAALGSLGLLYPLACVGILVLIMLVVLCLAEEKSLNLLAQPSLPISVQVYPVAALLLLALCVGLTQAPIEYDALTYHLYFPARWLQEGRMMMIPTPFSDQSPAYAPCNGELFFLWLMLPFHGDLLAGTGQFPFLLFSALVLFGLARKLGASTEAALLPACFFCLSKPVLEQAMGANVDLIFTGMFLSTVYLWMSAAQTKSPQDFVLLGVSLGLWLGTKFIALVFLPILLLFGWAIGGFSRRIVWALPGILLFGASWYVRNWLLTGSPVYPASLELMGVTIAEGAYRPQVMLDSPFHIPGLQLLPAVVALAFGPKLFLAWIPFALMALVGIIRQKLWRPQGLVAMMPLALVAAHWYLIPYNSQIRFLFPATALAMLLVAMTPGFFRGWEPWFKWGSLAIALWLILGLNPAFNLFGVPVIREGLLNLRYFPVFMAVLAVLAASIWYLQRGSTRAVIAMLAVCLGLLNLIVVCSLRAAPPDGCRFVHSPPVFLRGPMVESWKWIDENIHGANISYAGNNVPYRLMGRRLANRVAYANVSGAHDWMFHDFELKARQSAGYERPKTAKPGFDRKNPDLQAWLGNLAKERVGYLFVSILSEEESSYIDHDTEGFPIERFWADSDPNRFRLLFHNPFTRIYAVQAVR